MYITYYLFLRRISGRSGSDSSAGGARGVLKRMARVTSDEMNQAVSPGRVPSNEEQKGVLGAGLPLLQRLKLLKEKEEKEDKERQRLKEEENTKQQKQPDPPSQEEEPEVIGAGLPLFARLRLLKAKEEKERMEREERERTEREKAGEQHNEVITNKPDAVSKKVASPVTDAPIIPPKPQQELVASKEKLQPDDAKPRPAGMLKGKLRAALLTSAAATAVPSAGTGMPVASASAAAGSKVTATSTVVSSPTAVSGSAGTTVGQEKKESADLGIRQQLKSPINDLNKGVETKTIVDGGSEKVVNNDSPVISKETHSNSNSVQGGQALERAFGKLLSKKLNNTPKERTSVPVIDKPLVDSSKNTTIRDKISRSDSFKKAMDEGRIRSTEEHDLNIKPHGSAPKLQSTRESDSEDPEHVLEEKKVGESQSENEVSPVNEEKPVIAQKQGESTKKSSDIILKCDMDSKPVRGGSREDEGSPVVAQSHSTGSESAVRQCHKVDSLKVIQRFLSQPTVYHLPYNCLNFFQLLICSNTVPVLQK